MNDIEIGDYVRTRRGIGKVLEIKTVQPKLYGKYDVAYLIDVCPRMYISESTFIKHSKNIIDLIEVGDFVNGREVKHIAMFEGFPNYPKLIFVDEKRLIPDDTCENDEIKTILTKEQYSQNCYTVERS